MKAFVAVLRRELAERWLIPVAAIFLGLAPLAAPFLPLAGYRGPELRGGTALALALIASYLLAVVLGSSVLARDLGERRLGFYFSRPLPGWAIWAGKLASALILALGSGVLVMLPSLLLGDRPDPTGLAFKVDATTNAGLWAGSVTLLVLLANAAAVMFRSRSPWLLFDLGAATVLTAVLWVEMSRLAAAGANDLVMGIQTVLLVMLLGALAAASLVQVLRARTDLRRGHRVLSLTLWGTLGLATLVVAGYERWVLAASPEDLYSFHFVMPAPAGNWVAVSGLVENRGDFQPVFLLDTRSGRYFRISTAWWGYEVWGGPVFSADGRHAVWLESGRRLLPMVAWRLDLDRPGARPVPTTIVFDENQPQSLALSPDGRRLAAIHRGRILVMDLATGRNLASVPVPPGRELWRDRLRFLASGPLRFYGVRGERDADNELRMIDLDPGTGKVVRSLVLPAPDEWASELSPSGDRLILETHDLTLTSSRVRIVNLATGEVSQPFMLQRVTGRAGFLDDDRLLLSERAGGRAILRLLDLRGTELRRFEIPADRLRVASRPSPESLLISIVPPGRLNDWSSRRTLLLDLGRGTLKPVVEGMVPAVWFNQPPGSPGTRLFFDSEGGLVEIDPATGSRRVILQPKKR